MLPFAKMGVGNLISAILYDGSCGAAIADVISPAKVRGLDQDAVDEFAETLAKEILGYSSPGEMVNELVRTGGIAFSASLFAKGIKAGGFVGGIAGLGLASVVMICAVGLGSVTAERIDGTTDYDEESFNEAVVSGIADVPLSLIEISTGIRLIDNVIDKAIDKGKTFIVEAIVE